MSLSRKPLHINTEGQSSCGIQRRTSCAPGGKAHGRTSGSLLTAGACPHPTLSPRHVSTEELGIKHAVADPRCWSFPRARLSVSCMGRGHERACIGGTDVVDCTMGWLLQSRCRAKQTCDSGGGADATQSCYTGARLCLKSGRCCSLTPPFQTRKVQAEWRAVGDLRRAPTGVPGLASTGKAPPDHSGIWHRARAGALARAASSPRWHLF